MEERLCRHVCGFVVVTVMRPMAGWRLRESCMRAVEGVMLSGAVGQAKLFGCTSMLVCCRVAEEVPCRFRLSTSVSSTQSSRC